MEREEEERKMMSWERKEKELGSIELSWLTACLASVSPDFQPKYHIRGFPGAQLSA